MNDILEELRIIADELGRFPRQVDLKTLKKFNLCYRIQKAGLTYSECAEQLGYKPDRKCRNHWNEETLLAAVKKICDECGGWPSKDQWEINFAEIRQAAHRCGKSLKYYRDLLGDVGKMSDAVPIVCKQCGHTFIPSIGKNWTRQKFCSNECCEDFYRLRQNARNAERLKQPKICAICGKTYVPRHTTKQKYCERKCFTKFRKRMNKALIRTLEAMHFKKNDYCHKLLGYSAQELLEHLHKYTSWNDLQGTNWHLDHIFPVKAFIDKGIFEVALICHLDNLQPIRAKENLSKGGKYDKEAFELWLENH